MPNTSPINDNAAITRYMIEVRARGAGECIPSGCDHKVVRRLGAAEMGEMKAAAPWPYPTTGVRSAAG